MTLNVLCGDWVARVGAINTYFTYLMSIPPNALTDRNSNLKKLKIQNSKTIILT